MSLVDQALDLLLRHDMAGFSNLFAEDAVLEFPFAAPGDRTEVTGRAAIADYLRGYPDLLDIREVVAKTEHQTTDPATVIAEFELAGVVTATQKPYRMRYIAVLTVRDGLFQHYRDYWSPLAAAEILGATGV